MTYRGPLYGPPPADMPPSKYKSYLTKLYEENTAMADKMDTNLSAWLLLEMLRSNAQVLDEYERITRHE